jgi:hypothetical protein
VHAGRGTPHTRRTSGHLPRLDHVTGAAGDRAAARIEGGQPVTSIAEILDASSPAAAAARAKVRLVSRVGSPSADGPDQVRTAQPDRSADPDRSFARSCDGPAVRSWPLLVLAVPAAVAVWSGWVGIGDMTGFGQVHPLPGIWGTLHLDTAVTLPVGVEAYAAYALRAWLSASGAVSARTRRFARWSAIGSLFLGMAGQVAYHLLTQAGAAHAPWAISTAVSCLPVLVLGMGAALAHLLRADSHQLNQGRRAGPSGPDCSPDHSDRRGTQPDQIPVTAPRERLAEADAAAKRLVAAGQRVSRRTLRAAGLHGSNADLGTLARIIRSQPTATGPTVDFI